jgi:hypothetical protein
MKRWHFNPTAARTGLLTLVVLLSACGHQSFAPGDDSAYSFIERARISEKGPLTLRAALPTASEVRALHGLDLHQQDIQPIWLEISNDSNTGYWAAHWSIDRNYFSPAEVAYMNRRGFSAEGYADLERWMLETALPRRIPPGETRSGFVYTNLTPGTKSFNLDVFGFADDFNFTMLIDVPGFVPDYRLVDFESLYAPEDRVDIGIEDVPALLENTLPCCASDSRAEARGLPLNLVLVGSGRALLRSLIRSQWRETQASESAVDEPHYFDGRPADGRFYLERDDGASQQLMLDIWLSRWSVSGEPIWVAQAYFREIDSPIVAALRRNVATAEQATLLKRFVGEAVSADLDAPQAFAMQHFWYNQSARKLGFTRGVGRFDADNPGATFDGRGYITRGIRAVVFVADRPVAFGDAELLFTGRDLGEPAEAEDSE